LRRAASVAAAAASACIAAIRRRSRRALRCRLVLLKLLFLLSLLLPNVEPRLGAVSCCLRKSKASESRPGSRQRPRMARTRS
jgi:hypothetical protein